MKTAEEQLFGLLNLTGVSSEEFDYQVLQSPKEYSSAVEFIRQIQLDAQTEAYQKAAEVKLMFPTNITSAFAQEIFEQGVEAKRIAILNLIPK